MKIIDIDIIEFGGLLDKHFTLSDGLNIFEGDNESGKSTLWLFIKFMLYGMPKKGTAEREKSINRTTHRALGSMTVETESGKYRIERSFSENSRGKVTVYDLVSGEKTFDGIEVGEAILGVPREVFDNSCVISQGAVSDLGGDKGVAAIRNMLTSADESVDVEKILKKLDAVRVSYRHRNGKGGRLYDMSESINSLRLRLEKATDSRLRISELEKKISENSSSMEESEKLLSEAQALTEKLQRAEILNRFRRLDSYKEKYSELESQRDALVKNELKTERIPTSTDIANLRALADNADRAALACEQIEERLNKLSSDSEIDKTKLETALMIEQSGGIERILKSLKRYSLMSVVGIVLAVISVATAFVPIVGLIVFGVLLALGITLFVISAAKCSRLVKKYGTNKKNIEAYLLSSIEEKKKQESVRELCLKLETENSIAKENAMFTLDQLKTAIERTDPDLSVTTSAAREEANRLEAFIDNYSSIKQMMDRLSVAIETETSALGGYDEAGIRAEAQMLDSIDVSSEQTGNKRRFYEERLRIQRARDRELRTELVNLKALSDDPTELSDKLALMNEQYEAAEAYYDAIVLAMDGIEKASASMRGNVTPIIGRDAGRMLDYLSEGRYGEISLNKNMELSLVDANKLTTTLDMMSGGTRDAAYIALRISLVKQIFGEEHPPILMDESLCYFDDTRMERMLSLIDGICKDGWQILLFTCHKREAMKCRETLIDATVFGM